MKFLVCLKFHPILKAWKDLSTSLKHKIHAYKVQLQVVDFAIISSRQTMEDIQSVLYSHTGAGMVGKLVSLRFEELSLDLMSSGE
jgi:hypothetical protein